MNERRGFFDELMESVEQMDAIIKESRQLTALVSVLVIGDAGEILWAASVEAGADRIDVAEGVVADGSPFNVRAYRVSASDADRKRAMQQEEPLPLCRREHQGRVFYTESAE